MWNACCPGASPETVSAILTPSGVCVSSAVPTFFPCESAKSAVAVLAVWAARAAAKRERTARPVIKRFMASTLLHFPSSTIIALGRRWFKGARRNHLTAARQCCRRSPRQVQAVGFRRRRRQGFRSPARGRVRALQPLFGPAPCGPGGGRSPRYAQPLGRVVKLDFCGECFFRLWLGRDGQDVLACATWCRLCGTRNRGRCRSTGHHPLS